MNSYDPDTTPDDWLRLDEGERIELVDSYHRQQHVRLPDTHLHATIHVVVENQLALGEKVVVDTLARLRREGLSRHDAVHAIGAVLADDLYTLMHEDADRTDTAYARYLERLQQLTAKDWRAGVLP